MKVVKVDGSVFLVTEFENGELIGAVEVQGKLTDTLSKKDIGEFFTSQNLGTLLSMEIGAHSAVSSRDLKDEEHILITTAEMTMDVSKGRAIKALVNKDFLANF